MMILRSIKCLDVVCLLARLLEHIGQPALFSLAADHATDKAEHGGQIVTIAPDVLTRELGVAFRNSSRFSGFAKRYVACPGCGISATNTLRHTNKYSPRNMNHVRLRLRS